MTVLRRRTAGGRFAGWSQRVRGESVMVLSPRIVSAGVGVVFVTLTARVLGPTGRGEIAVAFTIAYLTAKLADLGTSTSGRIHLLDPDHQVGPNDIASLTIALIPLQAILAVIAVGLLSLSSLRLDLSFSMAVIGLSTATMMLRGAVAMLYGLRRYAVVLMAETAAAVIEVVALVVLWLGGLLTAASAVTTMGIGSALCAAWLVSRPGVLQRGAGNVLTTHWRTLIVDGISPMFGDVLFLMALRLDRLVLAVVAGAHQVGLYAAAMAIPETLRILPMAVGQVLADRSRSGIDSVVDVRRHGRLVVLGYLLVLIIGALVGFVALPLAFGEGFSEARDVLVIVMIAELFMSVHLMQQAALLGFGRPRGIGVPRVIGGAVTVVLGLVMIPTWGLHGAAWASLIGYAVLAATAVLWTNRELRRVQAP